MQHTRQGVIVEHDRVYVAGAGVRQPLDARSDIFSFGVVLYELLATTGVRSPLQPTSRSCRRSPIARTIRYRRCLHALRMIVDKALEKDPADRYQTLRDLVVDLVACHRARREEPGHADATRTPRRVRYREPFAW